MLENITNIPLSLAVFFATDDYDHNPDPNTISATSIIKPLKQIVMGMRVNGGSASTDVSTLIPSRIGTALHTAIEASWRSKKLPETLKRLGIPESVVKRIKINPTADEMTKDTIPVYMELRREKSVQGIKVSGKYDFVAEGRLEDFKSTSVYAWIFKSNDEKYIMQGSIYRWLNPDIITQDEMDIQFIFTDWSKSKARMDKQYPQSRTKRYPLKLKSAAEVESYLSSKIIKIKNLIDEPESKLPACNDEDLWRSAAVWKYYKDPKKTSRSTKNFDNPTDANSRLIADGNKGIVIEMKGQVKACNYCNAIDICEQAKTYIDSGELVL
jgi:hypothetical protein